jgi:Rho GDP-dissociation inhibitor
MQRYKQSLGLGGTGKDLSDPNDPRHCIILSLTMDSEGRAPVEVDLSAKGSELTLKDKPFKIKEGAKFSMSAKFKVQHQILSGLHYVQIVKRKGIRVSKDQEMIVCLHHSLFASVLILKQGSFAPNTDQNPFYTKKCKLSLPLPTFPTEFQLTIYSRRGIRPDWNACPWPLYRTEHVRR